MNSNALRVSVAEREDTGDERTDLAGWARTVLLIESRSKRKPRGEIQSLRALAASRILQHQRKERQSMKTIHSFKHSRAAQTLLLCGLTAVAALGQSGDLSAATAPIQTAGVNVIKLVMALVLLACVGVIAYGAATLGSNKPRALAMIAGGIVGGIIAGASYALIGTTSGATVPTAVILLFR
jgi:hypothetical protein